MIGAHDLLCMGNAQSTAIAEEITSKLERINLIEGGHSHAQEGTVVALRDAEQSERYPLEVEQLEQTV